MTDLARLQAIADAATPGPWEGGATGRVFRREGSALRWVANAFADGNREHIATFDPPTVSKLLAVVEAANEIVSPDYLDAPEPYAQGVRLDAMRDLMAALEPFRDTEGR